MDQKITTLTPLRGVAALWVMLFHIEVIMFYRDFGGLSERATMGMISKGYLWVDFFFILSGFIITHVYGERLSQKPFDWRVIGDYLWARLVRIYPLHLATLGFVVVIAMVAPYFFPQIVDGSWKTYMALKAIPSNLMLTHAMNQHEYLSWNIVSWSIGAEFWTYICAIVLIFLVHKRPAWMVGIMTIIASALLIGLVYSLPDKNLDITFNYGFFRCLFEFTLGLCLYQLYRKKWGQALFGQDALVFIAFGIIASVFYFKLNDLIIVPVLMLLILSAAYNQGLIKRLCATKPLQYLGDISYALYLMHGVWFIVFWFALPELRRVGYLPSLDYAQRWGVAALFFVATFVSAHIMHKGFEVKIRSWLRPKS